jgi:twinkle protein
MPKNIIEEKDFNDVLRHHGAKAVIQTIQRAKPVHVEGLYTIGELPPEPPLQPFSTGFGRLDEFIKPFYPAFMVVTGFAGSGKSSFVNQMVAQMCLNEGMTAAIATFEMRIQPFVTEVLENAYLLRWPKATREQARDWVAKTFVFIVPEPNADKDGFDVDWLVERAEAAVIRHNIRILVIDPWNEIEHSIRQRESLTEYTGRAIRRLKGFGRDFETLVCVVAHPTKSAAQKPPEEVSLYDVSDSAHFANKPDFGIVVARKSGTLYDSEIFVKKVRYQPLSGKPGSVILTYDQATRTFSQ